MGWPGAFPAPQTPVIACRAATLGTPIPFPDFY